MRILHFTNKPIYPSVDGGCLAMKSCTELLNKSEDITLFHFTLSTHKHPFVEKSYNEKSYAAIENSFVNTKNNIFELISNLVQSNSYNVSRFYSNETEKQLKEFVVNHRINIAVIESIYLYPYFALLKKLGVRIYLRTHNIEHELWEQKAKETTSFFKGLVLRKLAKSLKITEIKAWEKADGILAITNADLKKVLPYNKKSKLINPTVNVSAEPSDYTLNDFYFLGAFDWKPNEEALNWLINDVINEKEMPAKLHIAGKGLSKEKFSGYKYIINHGEVQDAQEFISAHGIACIPLLSGGGIKMKTLEGLALGKPIVTTKEGVRGLTRIKSNEICVTHSAEEFYGKMITFHEDAEERKKIGSNGKQYLIDNFTFESEQKKLIEFISK